MVSTEVRELIEDARDQVKKLIIEPAIYITHTPQDAANSNGSETNEIDQGYPPVPSLPSESTLSSTSSRILLPLPVPSPLQTVSSRLTPTPTKFDSVSPPTVVPISTGPSPAPGISSSQTRLSIDAGLLHRLPSITPDGQLIDPIPRELSPPKLQRLGDVNPDFATERFGMLAGSPTSQTSSAGGSFTHPDRRRTQTDTEKGTTKLQLSPG